MFNNVIQIKKAKRYAAVVEGCTPSYQPSLQKAYDRANELENKFGVDPDVKCDCPEHGLQDTLLGGCMVCIKDALEGMSPNALFTLVD